MNLLDHVVTLDLAFQEAAERFPKQLNYFVFSPEDYESLYLSASLPTFIIGFIFNNNISNGHKVVSHCRFGFYLFSD